VLIGAVLALEVAKIVFIKVLVRFGASLKAASDRARAKESKVS